MSKLSVDIVCVKCKKKTREQVNNDNNIARLSFSKQKCEEGQFEPLIHMSILTFLRYTAILYILVKPEVAVSSP